MHYELPRARWWASAACSPPWRRRPVHLRLARRTIENLKRLPADYPALKVIPLEQNYRSTGAILRAANNVIAGNPKIYEKKLWSEYGDGDPISLLGAMAKSTGRTRRRASELRAATATPNFKRLRHPHRANHQARIFEQALRRAQIRYKVAGGQSFFDRAEIKDPSAWLRLLVNQDDDPAFLRAVSTPGAASVTRRCLLGEFAAKAEVQHVRGVCRVAQPALSDLRHRLRCTSLAAT